MLRVLLVDDEPLAHDVILYHLKGSSDLKIVGQCYAAAEALAYLSNHSIDLLILDINMPSLSGIEMLRVLANRPQVILVSAYPEYAIEGFELDVTDYLVKPVSSKRLMQAISKVQQRASRAPQPQFNAQGDAHFIVLRADREKRKYLLNTISHFEAYGNFVKVWQNNEMTLVNATLKKLIAELPQSQFTQVHKSFVVNNEEVAALNSGLLTLTNKKKIKIGGSYKKNVVKLFDRT